MTDQNTDALRCAETMERESRHGAAAHLRRLVVENEVINAELMEQARLLGMSGEREARHLTVMRQALEALEFMEPYLATEQQTRDAAITALRQSLGE